MRKRHRGIGRGRGVRRCRRPARRSSLGIRMQSMMFRWITTGSVSRRAPLIARYGSSPSQGTAMRISATSWVCPSQAGPGCLGLSQGKHHNSRRGRRTYAACMFQPGWLTPAQARRNIAIAEREAGDALLVIPLGFCASQSGPDQATESGDSRTGKQETC